MKPGNHGNPNFSQLVFGYTDSKIQLMIVIFTVAIEYSDIVMAYTLRVKLGLIKRYKTNLLAKTIDKTEEDFGGHANLFAELPMAEKISAKSRMGLFIKNQQEVWLENAILVTLALNIPL